MLDWFFKLFDDLVLLVDVRELEIFLLVYFSFFDFWFWTFLINFFDGPKLFLVFRFLIIIVLRLHVFHLDREQMLLLALILILWHYVSNLFFIDQFFAIVFIFNVLNIV